MSVEASAWAFAQSGMGQGAKFVLVALANHADKAGVAYPGRELLARECECRPETVTGHLRKLEELGLLARHERRRKSGSRTSDWAILAPNSPHRGHMIAASTEEYPSYVAARATRSPWESSPELRSPEIYTVPHLGKTGGPEPLEEPSEPPTVASQPSLPQGEVCLAFSRMIRDRYSVDPKSTTYAVGATWAAAARGVVEIDRAVTDYAELAKVCEWVVRHTYWGGRVRSMPKLRQELPEILKQMRGEGRPRGGDAKMDAREQRTADRLERAAALKRQREGET